MIYRPIFERNLELLRSQNAVERESLLFGTLVANGAPLQPPVKSLLGHVYLRGSPGTGKTTFLTFLAETLLSRGPCGMQIFDIKDPPTRDLFAGMQEGAARTGIPVKWFSDDEFKYSHIFNIFKQRFWRKLSPIKKAALLGIALGVVHKLEGYGKQVFGGAAFSILLAVFKHWEIGSWVELHKRLLYVARKYQAFGLSKFTAQSVSQLAQDVERLAQIQPLNTEHSSIDLCSDKPQAIYWSFPDAYDLAGTISRLALFASFSASKYHDPEVNQWIFIDEFQRCIGNQVELMFTQAREKFGLILANQCLADLETRERDYAPLVQTCCRVHVTFNIADPKEQLFFAETSGTFKRNNLTSTYQKGPLFGLYAGHSRSYTEVEAYRYGLNDVKVISATPGLAFFCSTIDEGFVQFGGFPQAVQTEFHITKQENERRKALPMPEGGDGTILVEMPGLLPPGQPKPPNIVNPGKPPRRAPKNPMP